VFFVCEEQCILLQSEDGKRVSSTEIRSLFSSQEEADTRIILHCMYASNKAASDVKIIVRSPDTDVFLLLIYFSWDICHAVLFDTGTGNKRRLLNTRDIAKSIGVDMSHALLGFHAMTGSDCTSAFVRHGKLGPLKLLEKNSTFVELFNSFGSSEHVTDASFAKLEQFVCHMYRHPTYRNVDELRCDIFKSRYQAKLSKDKLSFTAGIDLSLLPPCRSSLRLHCERANYQTMIWKRSHIAYSSLPSPTACGWILEDDGSIAVEWVQGDLKPQQLVGILASREESSRGERNVNLDDELIYGDDVEEDYEVDNILDIIFEDDDL